MKKKALHIGAVWFAVIWLGVSMIQEHWTVAGLCLILIVGLLVYQRQLTE